MRNVVLEARRLIASDTVDKDASGCRETVSTGAVPQCWPGRSKLSQRVMSASSVGVLLALFLHALAPFAPCEAADVADVADPSYTLPTLNETYASNPRFIAHGLAPLYDLVGLFLRGIQQKDLLPPDLLVVNNGTIGLSENIDYGSVAQFYVGILAVLAVGLAVALLAPCIGVLWCCCRCCGSSKRSGQRLYDDDDDGSGRKKKKRSGGPVLAPLVLSLVTCLIVAGVAIAFAANVYIENGVVGLGKHITSGTSDIRLFIDNAETEVNTILGVNYNELSTGLNSVLEGAKTETKGIVDGFVSSLPLDEIDKMVSGIETIQKDLDDIILNINDCTSSSNEIVTDIKAVINDLQSVCQNLGPNCPQELQDFISSLKTPSFNPLTSGDIEKSITDLSQIFTSDFKTLITTGRKQVDNIGSQVERVMNDASTEMNTKINETGKDLQQRASELLRAATNASDTLLQVDQEISHFQDRYSASYGTFRISGFTAYSAVILIIAALITLGLVYGSCCSKTAYSFLNIPVLLILLTISVWMLIALVLFIAGVATDRACEFLRKPGDHQLTHLVDELLQKYRAEIAESSQLPPLHSIKYYIEECRADKTMYEVIDLDSTIQIDNILQFVKNFDFTPYLKTIDENVQNVVNVKLLPQDIRNKIEDLKNSDLSKLGWDRVTNELDSFQKTAQPLSESIATWAQTLSQVAANYPAIDVKDQVSNIEEILKKVESLQTLITQLIGLINKSSSDVMLGHKSFPEALQWLLDQASNTDQLVVNTAPGVTKLASNTAEGFRKELQAYLQWAVDRVKSHALKCKPIINIYDSMVMGVCDEIISPWNAFWAMSGLCLLLFIPAAFVASSLASHKS
ncbi:prominin-1-like [Thrips palmi]|uniref:Prominin-1-like n=1 Tax=Thrips palmi TaxID=161013 RepID=A0A6P8YLZ9_THRPL|nr:prominin-1-like [Thrips palmi]